MKANFTKLLISMALIICMAFSFTSCAWFQSEVNSLNGSITGNTYDAMFYSNDGELFMTMRGEKIQLNANVVKEAMNTIKAYKKNNDREYYSYENCYEKCLTGGSFCTFFISRSEGF